MCKKFFALFLTLMISLSGVGCSRPFSDSDMDIYEKIHKTYNTLKSYSADLDLTVYSNKTQNRYFASQKCLSPDKFYMRVTDEDGTFSVTTITNNAVTKTTADGSEYSLTIPSEEYLSLLFVNNFFKAYYASEETSLSVDASSTESDKTVLSVSVAENDLSISSVSLSVDNKTLAPYSITVFGPNDQKLAYGKYENFKLNDKIDESIFYID